MSRLRRVFVTGVGAVSPLGIGAQLNWERLVAGKCGVRRLLDERFAADFAIREKHRRIYERLPSTLVGTVPGFDWDTLLGRGVKGQMSRGTALSLLAAMEAWQDAKMPDGEEDSTAAFRDSCGTSFGMGMVDLDDVHDVGTLLDQGRHRRVSPYFVPRILTNMSAGWIGMRLGLRGPNHAVSTACATGAHAIGDAFDFIRDGRRGVEAMVCGGADACVSPIALAGFARCKALAADAHFADEPHSASRPFDAGRRGFVLAEGAGALVLESEQRLRTRLNGAGPPPTVYAEVVGYGLSGDAHHVTAPDEQGEGAYLAMRRALEDAGVQPADVGYINAHATSTPLGDLAESLAVARLFGTRPMVSSTKGATGHLLGGAGAVESMYTVLALKNYLVPPTVNFESTDIGLDLDYVPNEARRWRTADGNKRVALCNSFGFGGTNASLCFREVDEEEIVRMAE